MNTDPLRILKVHVVPCTIHRDVSAGMSLKATALRAQFNGVVPERGCGEARGRGDHVHSLALFTTYYNFVRVHKTLRVSPAMAAGVADRLWEVADIVKLVEAGEAKPAKRGPYRKRSAAEVIE